MKVMGIIDRTVSLIESKDYRPSGDGEVVLRLRDFEAHSYVLIGEPGMGKSTEFKQEACRIHATAPIPAHQFISRKPENHPEWRKGPLFIDGLDEVRVGRGDPRDALNKIIDHLETLGKPQFRLSCRSINWLEPADREKLATLSDSKDFSVLLLNPLGYEDIREIISEPKASTFIRQAHNHSMEAFLFNPQLLGLLRRSVEADGWPDSPSKTFENACKELINERNREHRDARSSEILPNHDEILSASGQLSALMLLTNKVGWSVYDTEDSDILSFQDVSTKDSSALRVAFNSGLFQGNSDYRTPIHRILAEFLAARYLHNKIQDGLSVRRVFALLMGEDGVPFPDLRGLSAWLASLNPQVRKTLIHADPVAVAFNGDTSRFTLGERRELLNYLERNFELTQTWPSVAVLGALVGDQGASLIQKLTGGSPVRSQSRQILVYQLLRGVSQRYSNIGAQGKLIPEIESEIYRDNLLNIVYDPSWNKDIRCEALRALNLILVGKSDRKKTYDQIFSDLGQGFLSDEKNDLRGTLLNLLYPGELSPSEVWNYLADKTVAYRYNSYLEFWHCLSDRLDKTQIAELLDSLCDRASELIPKLGNNDLSSIVPKLLARGLTVCGDELNISDLYRWFKLVESDVQTSQLVSIYSADYQPDNLNDEASAEICNWLNEHKTIQRALIEHDLLTQESKIEKNVTIGVKFVGKNTSTEFRLWCLSRAAELWDTHPIAAERLAWWSVRIKEGWGSPLSDEEVEEIVSDYPCLLEWNRKRLISRNQDEQREPKWSKEFAERRAARQRERQEEVEAIRQQKSELATGNCKPQLLHHLASIYFNGFATEGGDPKSQLVSYLEEDMSLVQAALAGFHSLLDRDGLPDLDQIAQLHENSRMSAYTMPFLAGMLLGNDGIFDNLSKEGRRRALGFYLVTDRPIVQAIPRGETRVNYFSFYERYRPSWYQRALEHDPEAVADSLVAIHKACVRAKLSPNRYLYEVANNPRYAQVARLAVKRMFSVFPTRCSERQLESLRLVLWGAIRAGGVSTKELRNLALKRLQRKNMDIAQRAQWLCAGVYSARDRCLELLEEFLSTGQESRLTRVLSFMVPDVGKITLGNVEDWSSEEICWIIRVLGKRVQNPKFQEDCHFLSKEEINAGKFRSLLTSCLKELTRRGDNDARESLDSLANNPDLTAWKGEIVPAREELIWKLRLAKRPDLSLEKVQKTLNNGPPSSAADLTALTTDILEELADRIRNGPDDEWHQYWCRDSNTNKLTQPQHENDCRDVLLSHLRARLNNYQITGEREAQYADENRADIRISYGSDLAIPIEIKRSHNPDIWKGISEQLVTKYTRDPKADGYGIYLVFWFGAKYMGATLNDPKELENLLKERLDPALRKKVYIIVIDVSSRGRYVEER